MEIGTKSTKLRDLISDFLLITSPTVDIEFFSRFLNSDAAARVAYDGQRLASNGYTKFYVILNALQHIEEIQHRRGPLYAMLTMSASRHKLYAIPKHDARRLHQKLLKALLWTFRSAFRDEWCDEYEQLVDWGWNIISQIYLGADRCHEQSINHRLAISRRNSSTFNVSKIKTPTGIQSFFSSLGSTEKQQQRSFLSHLNPKRATNIQDLDIFNFPTRSSLSDIHSDCISSKQDIQIIDNEGDHKSNTNRGQTQVEVVEMKKVSKTSASSRKQPKPSTPSKAWHPTSSTKTSGFDCLNAFYRADVPISVYILTTILRVFVRSTQFFDQLSDILLAVNLWSNITSSTTNSTQETLDKVLVRVILVMPLLPYLALIPLLYRAVFQRLRRSGNTLYDHHPSCCRLIYILSAIPVFITLDLYVYSVKLFSNLSETKYLYPYWGTRSVIEIILESIPQSVLLLILFVRSTTNENAVIDSVPLGLMIFGFMCSFVNTLVRLGELRYAAKVHDKLPWKYVSEHLFQFNVLPWSDGLQLNQITSLHIRNDLSLPEWIEFLQYLKVNTSLQSIRCDGYLGIALSLSLLRCIRNNVLTVIDLGNAQLFANIRMKLVDGDTRKYLQAILPTDNNDMTGQVQDENAVQVKHQNNNTENTKNDLLDVIQTTHHERVPQQNMDTLNENAIEQPKGPNASRRAVASSMFDDSIDSEEIDHRDRGRQMISSFMINEDDDSEEVDQFDITCDEVAIELLRILDRNENLRQLNLSNNEIGDRSHLLFGSIVNATNLRMLDLSKNNLSHSTCGDALGRHLGNIIIYCPRLHTFCLDANALRDDEVYVLLDGFAERKSRIELALSVTDNLLTFGALKALKECSRRKKVMTFKFEPQRKLNTNHLKSNAAPNAT